MPSVTKWNVVLPSRAAHVRDASARIWGGGKAGCCPTSHSTVSSCSMRRAAAEHVASHDRGAEVRERFLDDAIAFVDLAPGPAFHLVPEPQREDPLVQAHSADADGIVDPLIRAGDETVERHRDPEAQLRHPTSPAP